MRDSRRILGAGDSGGPSTVVTTRFWSLREPDHECPYEGFSTSCLTPVGWELSEGLRSRQVVRF